MVHNTKKSTLPLLKNILAQKTHKTNKAILSIFISFFSLFASIPQKNVSLTAEMRAFPETATAVSNGSSKLTYSQT